jgi:hypothetical protein
MGHNNIFIFTTEESYLLYTRLFSWPYDSVDAAAGANPFRKIGYFVARLTSFCPCVHLRLVIIILGEESDYQGGYKRWEVDQLLCCAMMKKLSA